ncbi:MAG: hypothetical protein JWM10_414 [Myxococcaceae bacterium]|nr:hypothetical protein [Myxococcaceae bacterium]
MTLRAALTMTLVLGLVASCADSAATTDAAAVVDRGAPNDLSADAVEAATDVSVADALDGPVDAGSADVDRPARDTGPDVPRVDPGQITALAPIL